MPSLHDHVVDSLGERLVGGGLTAGQVILSESLEREFGVSRSVVREAVRVLRSLGMVTSIKSVGIRVLPRAQWDMLDPLVIRWRLAGADRGAQLRSLSELRMAVEPLAAELAAVRADEDAAARLVGMTERMTELGRAGDVDGFLSLDVAFHRSVLVVSGNELFSGMGDIIEAVLRGRTEHGLQPVHPHEEALGWHRDVAHGIAAGEREAAGAAMQAIMRRTIAEVEHLWRGVPHP
ncbi:FadR/GntR family transcriptional regulator [Desertivibrio insolitus]|uniref:FadR/GntR family transcriptional regulator n=1 Tax=Herbiconiux sp. SYSU D00978 TaxID=2812562 RepID=UPI001A95EB9C|nr:FCD domain-containing protein [Herbiconiux sp. SYSU D00978]